MTSPIQISGASPAPLAPAHGPTIPTEAQILGGLPESRRSDGEARELARRLAAFLAAADLRQRVDAWVELVGWVQQGLASATAEPGMGSRTQVVSGRVLLLVRLLQPTGVAQRPFLDALADLLRQCDGTNLFGAVGIPSERGFLAEASDRILQRILPQARDDRDLTWILHRLVPDEAGVGRFGRIPPAWNHELMTVLSPADRPEIWQPVRASFADGFRLLALRAASQGMSPKMRERTQGKRVESSPFILLEDRSRALVAAWEAGPVDGALIDAWHFQSAACRAELAEIHRQLQDEGVSVDIVFAIDVVERCLRRMGDMVAIMAAGPGLERTRAIQNLITRLMQRHLEDRSVAHLAGANLQLLHRKIVDRSSETGDHYIADDRAGYRHIWWASMGGGVLTTFTAAFKTGISVFSHGIHLAPAATGMLYGLNYAASFIAMQHLGLMLATKQPAMTAAALAVIMRDHQGDDRLERIVDRSAAICSSQLASAMGNVLVVALGAFLFDLAWVATRGAHWLDHEAGLALTGSLAPWPTIPYAMLTGVILWLSSLMGGWLDNWSVYHRLPQAIADHPLGDRFGRDRLARLAAFWQHHVSGWGTNISLGFMLGFTPIVGQVLGLPLDVRHVTLNSGIFIFAALAQDGPWLNAGFLWAIGGIASMFVCNLGVSFALSLFTAARAYGLPMEDLLSFVRLLGRRMLTRPGQFLFPPKAANAGLG